MGPSANCAEIPVEPRQIKDNERRARTFTENAVAMSNGHVRMIRAIRHAIREYQHARRVFEIQQARMLGTNVTGLRCLSLLAVAPPQGLTPSTIAKKLSLSTPSATITIARLQRAHLVVRSPHPTDQRKSHIRLAPDAPLEALSLGRALDEKIGVLVGAVYSTEEIDIVHGILGIMTAATAKYAETSQLSRNSARHHSAIGFVGQERKDLPRSLRESRLANSYPEELDS